MIQKSRNYRSAYCYQNSMNFRYLYISFITICLSFYSLLANASQSRKSDLPAYLDYATTLSCKFNYEQTIKLMYYTCLSKIQNDLQMQDLVNTNKIGSLCVHKISALPSTDYLDSRTEFDYPYFSNLRKYVSDINEVHKNFGFDEKKVWLSIFENSSDSCLEKELIQTSKQKVAKRLIEKHLGLATYYTSVHTSHYPNEKHYITYNRSLKTNPELNTISAADEISVGKFYHATNIRDYLHPQQEKNFLSLPIEFYNTFAINVFTGSGTTVSIANFDKSNLQTKQQVSDIKLNLSKVLQSLLLQKQNSATMLTHPDDHSLYVFIERSYAKIPQEARIFNTQDEVVQYFFLPEIARKANAYKYFELDSATDQKYTGLANYEVFRYNPEFQNYLISFLNWDMHKFKSEYEKLISFTEQSADLDDNAIQWLLRPQTFEILFALNFFKIEQFKADILFNQQSKSIFSITDISVSAEKNYALKTMKSISEAYYVVQRVSKKTDLKNDILKFLRKFAAYTNNTSYKEILSEIIQEFDRSSADAISSIQTINRKIESRPKELSNKSCTVAKVTSYKTHEGNHFFQEGVATLVQIPNKKSHWVTAAHVVADAEKVKVSCSNSTFSTRAVYIDQLKDIAFLEVSADPHADYLKPIPLAQFTDLQIRLALIYPSDSSLISATETYRFSQDVSFKRLDGNSIGLPHFGFKELIQITNFGIRPGMSGSPIINSKGEFVAMVTHTSLNQAESLAIPSWELLKPKDNRYKVKNSYEVVGKNIKKFMHVNFSHKNKNYYTYDLCGSNAYQASSVWVPVNGKTDWAGGSGNKKISGTYITSSAANINYGQYFQTYSNCLEGGISINGKKINATWNTDMSKFKKIDSVIALLQMMDKNSFENLQNNFVSDYKNISQMICGKFYKNQKKYFSIGGTITTESILNREDKDITYFSRKYNMYRSENIDKSDSKIICTNESFNLVHNQLLQLNAEGSHLTGSIQIDQCTEKIDIDMKSYSVTINGKTFKTNIDFNFSNGIASEIKLLIHDIQPHCSKNAKGSRDAIISLTYEIKND